MAGRASEPNEWRRRRKAAGYSQPAWARLLDVSQSLVSKWELTDIKPSADTIAKMNLIEPHIDPLVAQVAEMAKQLKAQTAAITKLVNRIERLEGSVAGRANGEAAGSRRRPKV